jgi:tetratricopeptide (TPR) repeat protein
MAEDLRRFTSGRLVSVHRYSAWTLVSRWIARRRTPFAVAAVLLSAMLVLAVVSVRRIVRERDRADVANRLAEQERTVAVTQRGAAERLVGFVISGLRDQLKDLGRLDVLGGVGHEVDAYYESLARSDQGPQAPEQVAARAAALETLAEVEDAKHDTERARSLYGAARALRHQLTDRTPDEATRADEGDLLVKMARFEMDQRSDDAAAPLDEEAKKLGDALLAKDATSRRGLALSAHAHQVASSLKRSGGDTAGAETEASRSVEQARRLSALESEAPAARRVLGESLAVQARADYKAGHSDRPSFDEAIAVRESLVAATSLAQDRIDLSESYEQRCAARRRLGNGEGSIADGRRAVATREELMAQDPENLRWVQLLGRSYDTLAYAYADTKHYEEGIASSRRALELLNRVARSTADGPEVHDLLLLAYQRLGVLLEVQKRYKEADEAMRPLVALAEGFAAKEKTKRWTSRLADTHVFLGTNAFAQGKTDEGVAEMQKALAIREPLEGPGIDAQDWGNAIGTRGTLVKYLKDPAELRRQRLKILDLFLLVQPEPGNEVLLQMIADACLGLLPATDPGLHDRIEKAVALLTPMRAKGDDTSTAPRLAMLAKAQRLLSN